MQNGCCSKAHASAFSIQLSALKYKVVVRASAVINIAQSDGKVTAVRGKLLASLFFSGEGSIRMHRKV